MVQNKKIAKGSDCKAGISKRLSQDHTKEKSLHSEVWGTAKLKRP